MQIQNIEFIHIPKTGGTTILSHLSTLDSNKFDVDRLHRTALQYSAIDNDFESKFTFSVVRNPYQRLVSLWQYELKKQLGTKNINYKHYLDFNVWLKEQACHLDWNRAFMILPQWHWISNWDNNCIIKKVYKFENFNDIIIDLSSMLNTKFDVNLVTNTSMKKHNYKEISNSESKNIMLKLCKVDCEKFNYDW
jgi:hypothetical protein